jgi:hypothetical protein
VTDPYAVPKPAEFVALGPLLELLFIELKHSRAVPDTHTFDLRHVDCADAALRDWSSVAAFALRKLQALRYLTKTGVRTRNSIVVILVADLNISLTDLAEEAERSANAPLGQLLLDGRDVLNRAAQAVSAISDGAVVELY